MKRILSVLLCAVLLLSLCACGGRAPEAGNAAPEPSASPKPTASAGGEAPPEESGQPDVTHSDIPPLPEDAGYWDRLEHEWKYAPEEGYVWTITISDTDVIDVLGLVTASYHVELSASHVGKDMYGAYCGEFAFDSSADMAGIEEMAGMLGGSMEYDGDVWFQNDRFVFSLDPYDEVEEEQLEAALYADGEYGAMSPEEQAFLGNLYGQVYQQETRDFEAQGDAAALWWDFDMPMTDGDLGASIAMTGLYGGLVNAQAETDKTGQDTNAVVHSIVGTFRESSSLKDKFGERYGDRDTYTYPMPYTLKVYPGNQVVMTFYSLDGSPVTIKCYGTMDRVPVEDTVVPGR